MVNIEKSVKQVEPVTPGELSPEVLKSAEPVLLKNLVADWPIVKEGKESVAAAANYFREMYEGATVCSFYGLPDTKGRVFYNDDMSGFNYQSVMVKLDKILDEIVKHENDKDAPMFYVGSTTVDTCLPNFRASNDIDLGDVEPLVSIWMGNRSRIAAHYDVPDNLACVVVGRRRFTLFPPGEIENLYIGPLDFTPAGQAISLVDFHQPDFEKYPKFETALRNAQVVEMEVGDALFIPSMWWHHVEGLDSFNVLINYWWRRSPAFMGLPQGVLNHALLAIRDLPKEQREAWREVLRHYVFEADDETAEHIPEQRRGVLSPIDEMAARRIRAELLNKLNR